MATRHYTKTKRVRGWTRCKQNHLQQHYRMSVKSGVGVLHLSLSLYVHAAFLKVVQGVFSLIPDSDKL